MEILLIYLLVENLLMAHLKHSLVDCIFLGQIICSKLLLKMLLEVQRVPIFLLIVTYQVDFLLVILSTYFHFKIGSLV